MVGFFIAVLSGILMSVQGVFNTQVTKQSSLWTTSAFVQLTALLVCVLAWLFTDRSNPLKVLAAKPSYLLLGGVIGAFITYTVVVSMGKLGPAKAVMFIVIAQLISAYLIELLGMFGVEKEPFYVIKKVLAIRVFLAYNESAIDIEGLLYQIKETMLCIQKE